MHGKEKERVDSFFVLVDFVSLLLFWCVVCGVAERRAVTNRCVRAERARGKSENGVVL